jgi:capsular polysaccharide biosynthesis protein
MEHIKSALEVISSRRVIVLATLALGLIVAGIVFGFMPRTYEAAARVLIVNQSGGRDSSVTSLDLPEVATSTVVLERVIDDLKIPVTLISLKRNIKAHVSERSSIMDISYRDDSSDSAVAVPNAVADELVRYYSSISTRGAEDDVRKLDAALNEMSQEMHSIDQQLGALAVQNPFLGNDKPVETLSNRLETLQGQRAQIIATLAGDQAAANATSPNSNTMLKIARHEILDTDSLHHELVDNSSKDAAQLALDEATFTDRYPKLRTLRQKVQTEQAFVQHEESTALNSPNAFSATQSQSALENGKAQALVTGDRSRLTEIDKLIADTRGQLQSIPDANTRFAYLRLQHDAAVANYLGLSNRRTQAIANRAESLSLGSVVVIDRAVRANATIVGSGRTFMALVTLFATVAVSLCMAFLAEALDPRLRRAEQIESLYGRPLITTLTGP